MKKITIFGFYGSLILSLVFQLTSFPPLTLMICFGFVAMFYVLRFLIKPRTSEWFGDRLADTGIVLMISGFAVKDPIPTAISPFLSFAGAAFFVGSSIFLYHNAVKNNKDFKNR